jgi:hypothetical protein
MYHNMIRSFKDKEAEKIFKRQRSSKLPETMQRVALRKLRMLNRAENLNDLRVPLANRLEKLKGDRLSGTIPGYRNVQRVLELPKQGFGLKSLTYEIVVASQGGRR